MADRVGQQLGNYRLLHLLGHGGFAEVYLGKHVYLDTEAAIKVLHTQLASDDVGQFQQEARLIARLIHPHIVRVLDFGVEGNTPFLVMDYAPNGTLRQHHPKGTRLPLPTVVSYIKQIAPALQYAHEQKLIHRDIKPENLLVGRTNEILLSDFGIALVAQSSRYQSTRDMAGTIAYMAPEQIEAHPRPASDQYSLGIVVYEWLSGDRPFHGSFTEIAIKHSLVPPPPLLEKVPEVSPAVEQVVLTALAKDPKQRFATVQAFATAFEQASLTSPAEIIPSDRRPNPIDKVAPTSQSQQPPEIFDQPSESFIPTELMTPAKQPSIPTGLSTSTSQGSVPPTEFAVPSTPSTIPSTVPVSPPQPPSSVAGPPAGVPNVTRVNLIPLGLVAFALTTLTISAANASLFSTAGIFGILDLFYGLGGLVQLIAGVQAMRTGNTFAATGFCSYGAFWLALSFSIQNNLIQTFTALGFFLLGWTIFTGLMFLNTLRSYKTLIAVFGFLFLTFLSLTIADLGGGSKFVTLGGWLGILTALIAVGTVWYIATHRSDPLMAPANTPANPLPLGLSAFALTSFVLSAFNAGLLPGGFAISFGLALFYAGLVQLIAGVQALRTGNTFAATAFCSNGAFWLVFGFIFWQNLIPNATVAGYFLLVWTISATIVFIVALTTKANIALIALFFVVLLTLLLLTIAELGGGSTFGPLGGWLGILSTIIAWYIALAFLLAERRDAFLLPVGQRR